MEPRLARLVGSLGLALSMGLLGCGGGDELPREPVSGTVTLGGQPLAQGRIEFEPNSPEAKAPAGGVIKDGTFNIPRAEGPTPGDYKVMITASASAATGVDTSPGAEAAKGSKVRAPQIGPYPELVPKEYNSKTTLTAKVEAGKTNAYEFSLNAKK